METTPVDDAEALYRRVENDERNFPLDQGVRRISGGCFSDRKLRPSVDRALMRGFNPALTQNLESDGVLGIYTHQIRGLTTTKNDSKGNPVSGRDYVADVEHVPLLDNPSHAEVFARPSFDEKSVFRRFCDKLKRFANWEIKPADIR